MQDIELAKLVEKHTVKYEVWRHWEIYDGKRVLVGFDLELHGTHDHGHTSLTPGCEHCQSTYRDLRSLAERVLPTEERPTGYDIEPFDNALHSEARGPDEVVLVVRIHHRKSYFDPIDDCEERCLKEMEDRLRSFGAQGRRRH